MIEPRSVAALAPGGVLELRAPVLERVSRLVGAAVVTWAVVALLAAVLVAQSGYSTGVVLSGSMRPALQPGDLVILQRIPVADVAPGMVLAIRTPTGETRIHRVVSFDAATGVLVTRGDANPASDTELRLTGTSAYVERAAVPWIGWLFDARVKAAVWLLAGLALLLVCGREVVRLILHR